MGCLQTLLILLFVILFVSGTLYLVGLLLMRDGSI